MIRRTVLLLVTGLTGSACAATAPAELGGTAAQTEKSDVGGVVEPGSVEEFRITIGDRVFFDFDSYVIRPDGEETLKKQAAWLFQYPQYNATVEGHADERGTREYNLALGERRASAVKNYLVALGIDPSRIQTISYGKERPEALGHDEDAWAQNRRVVTAVNPS
jgi:peptidoglycan-associated lipoprotein